MNPLLQQSLKNQEQMVKLQRSMQSQLEVHLEMAKTLNRAIKSLTERVELLEDEVYRDYDDTPRVFLS